MYKYLKKSIKQNIELQELEIRKIVNELDPLGIGEGFPEDEYDDLVHNIISILNRKDYVSKDKIELLTGKILDYADLSIKYKEQVLNTACRIMEWWKSKDFNI